MKNIGFGFLLGLVLISCGSDSEKIEMNAKQFEWKARYSDSIKKDSLKKSKTVSVNAFYMDESEFPPEVRRKDSVKNAAIEYLKLKDFKKLSEIVHPQKGLRFSPYTYVEKKHLVFTAAEVAAFDKANKKYVWGSYDGSGEPIKLTTAEYARKFIYDFDFAKAQMGNNMFFRDGNTANNIKEFYKDCQIIDLYFAGTNAKEKMDWASLRFVFEEKDGSVYLVGIVHAGWTI